MKTIGKTLLARRVEIDFSLSPQQADQIVDSIMQTIQQALVRGDKVNLPNICTMHLKAKRGITKNMFGKEITVPERRKLSVSMSRVLEDTVNLQPSEHPLVSRPQGKTFLLEELNQIAASKKF